MTGIRMINSLIFMKNARQAACCGDVESCISAFTKAFYLRNTPEDFFDIEFSSFFSYQFKVYLAGRGDYSLSLEEGDEVSRLIRETYDEMKISMEKAPFEISACGEWNLLKDLKINFRDKKTPFLTA